MVDQTDMFSSDFDDITLSPLSPLYPNHSHYLEFEHSHPFDVALQTPASSSFDITKSNSADFLLPSLGSPEYPVKPETPNHQFSIQFPCTEFQHDFKINGDDDFCPPTSSSTEIESCSTLPSAASTTYLRGHMKMPVRRPSLRLFWTPYNNSSIPRTLYPNFENTTIASILDTSPATLNAVFLLDQTSRMVLADQSMIQTFNPDSNPTFSCYDLVSPDSFVLCGVYKHACASGRALRGVSLNYNLNGKPTRVWVNITPVLGANQEPVAIKISLLLDSTLREMGILPQLTDQKNNATPL